MKLAGKKIEGPNISVIVIPRKNRDLVFQAQAVLNYDDFDKICPAPNAPEILKPGGIRIRDIADKNYLKSLDDWSSKKTSWMILKSLEASESLEWETINMSDSDTWDNYRSEMQASGLSPSEIGRIIGCVLEANALNQEKIDQATQRFLAGQEQELKNL